MERTKRKRWVKVARAILRDDVPGVITFRYEPEVCVQSDEKLELRGDIGYDAESGKPSSHGVLVYLFTDRKDVERLKEEKCQNEVSGSC